MCGRVVLDWGPGVDDLEAEDLGLGGLIDLAEGRPPIDLRNSWNVAPTQEFPIVAASAKRGTLTLANAHWSLVPSDSRTLQLDYPTFNARSETVAEKPTFAPSLRGRRCAVLTHGFYEWTGPKHARVPRFIHHPGGALVPMAGLYSWWRDPAAGASGEWVLTATILTRDSVDWMREIHDRQPVFLTPDSAAAWLTPETVGDRTLVADVSEASLATLGSLAQHPVRPLRGDGPELVLRAPDPGSDIAASDALFSVPE